MEITPFKEVLKNYLDKRAQEDKQFAASYAKPNKSLEECCKYIIREVEKVRDKAQCVPVQSDEVFGMAIHYYDEDDIVVEEPKTKVTVTTSTSTDQSATQKDAAGSKNKTRKPRKAKVETDPNIPEPLDIPIF